VFIIGRVVAPWSSLFKRCLYVMLLLSQKVIWCAPCHVWLSTAGRRIEHQEVCVHLFVELHDSCLVSATVAVVWRRKDGHDLLFVGPIVTSHDQLMRSGDSLETILLCKLGRYIHAERVAGTTGTHSPPLAVFWIGPKKIAHWSFMRHFLYAI